MATYINFGSRTLMVAGEIPDHVLLGIADDEGNRAFIAVPTTELIEALKKEA